MKIEESGVAQYRIETHDQDTNKSPPFRLNFKWPHDKHQKGEKSTNIA